MADECIVDLTNAPFLREMLGVTNDLPRHGRPMSYTEPHRQWSDDRRIAASNRMVEMRAAKMAAEFSDVIDPANELSDIEKLILARLAAANDLTGEQIANARWPFLEDIKTWLAMLNLQKAGLIFPGATSPWSWRLTGCGRLRVAAYQHR